MTLYVLAYILHLAVHQVFLKSS